LFSLIIVIKSNNYYNRDNNIYYKAGFVEIVRIFVKNTIFGFNIIYKCKLFTNNFWIFTFSLLVIIFICKMYLKFWLVFNKIVSLVFTNKKRIIFVK